MRASPCDATVALLHQALPPPVIDGLRKDPKPGGYADSGAGIDCRADAAGTYRLFDLNMKPNMTGAGRPGRGGQDSLSAIAARALGWRYAELPLRVLDGAWRER